MLYRCRAMLTAAFIGLAGCAAATCHENAISLRGAWGQARFNIEVARTDDEKRIGLMHRQELPLSSGMLFLYDSPQPLSFWMRNTLIELDLLFVDSHGVITVIHHKAQPLDETPMDGGIGVAVLEINGGLAKSMGISVGSQVQHHFFEKEDPIWPC